MFLAVPAFVAVTFVATNGYLAGYSAALDTVGGGLTPADADSVDPALRGLAQWIHTDDSRDAAAALAAVAAFDPADLRILEQDAHERQITYRLSEQPQLSVIPALSPEHADTGGMYVDGHYVSVGLAQTPVLVPVAPATWDSGAKVKRVRLSDVPLSPADRAAVVQHAAAHEAGHHLSAAAVPESGPEHWVGVFEEPQRISQHPAVQQACASVPESTRQPYEERNPWHDVCEEMTADAISRSVAPPDGNARHRPILRLVEVAPLSAQQQFDRTMGAALRRALDGPRQVAAGRAAAAAR